ncbi:hypothetical protein BV20DRAFT_1052395 [Pilatotrama ljubarskyi]|nr:hypothetical protein BV20DRAFT_1052395 [Pilatotrama ljubarskyi]
MADFLTLVAGGAISRVDPVATGLNPASRDANVHVMLTESWPEGTNSSAINQLRQAGTAGEQLRSLAPQSGAYLDKASLYETNPKQTLFRSHYKAIEATKKVYDPLDLFVVAEGVGSDD